MSKQFSHRALELVENKPLVYTAFSKHLFYFRVSISRFVLENGAVPLNPFMIFDYFLFGTVDRDLIHQGNSNLVKRADELWVFGTVSNGVLAEIQIAKEMKKPIRYFAIKKPHRIVECQKNDVTLEEDVKDLANQL